MTSRDAPTQRPAVLIVVDDGALGDVLLDAMADAGREACLVLDESDLQAALAGGDTFCAAIVDSDARGASGTSLLSLVRRLAPSLRVIALLPCGGAPSRTRGDEYEVGLEMPVRLAALTRALDGGARLE